MPDRGTIAFDRRWPMWLRWHGPPSELPGTLRRAHAAERRAVRELVERGTPVELSRIDVCRALRWSSERLEPVELLLETEQGRCSIIVCGRSVLWARAVPRRSLPVIQRTGASALALALVQSEGTVRVRPSSPPALPETDLYEMLARALVLTLRVKTETTISGVTPTPAALVDEAQETTRSRGRGSA